LGGFIRLPGPFLLPPPPFLPPFLAATTCSCRRPGWPLACRRWSCVDGRQPAGWWWPAIWRQCSEWWLVAGQLMGKSEGQGEDRRDAPAVAVILAAPTANILHDT
jgi:hypothetical protein